MSKYRENYRGHIIEVLRDDEWPVVRYSRPHERSGITTLTVRQARNMIDHKVDRSCANHGGRCGEALNQRDATRYGAMAGAQENEFAA